MSTEMESMIRKILEDMQKGAPAPMTASTTHSAPTGRTATVADYPIAKKHPEWIRVGDKGLDDITLDSVMNGQVSMEDMRISPEILKAQGQIAKAGGRDQIEFNFSRAAEMTKVGDKRLLEMYNALRPYRSSKQELLAMADELEREYGAVICADFVREAAENYERRKKLKGDN
ncbi:diol dehydratase small subunit [Veillonella criceti]|uniref:Propanediol dehydratase small subunit n=1 Tax=Veillonella criceti TaxID=103891 RepID=A0A380NM82_9FIRM|nr:diol dehydratase small subunit [Veillonella criceti]SUP44283.1 Propanediol dehydratase small subunit [Veillonella criceti]